MYVCNTAVSIKADHDLMPSGWLTKFRWGEGNEDADTLPNGEKITVLTGNGSSSAIVESRRKKAEAVGKRGRVDAMTGTRTTTRPQQSQNKSRIVLKEEDDATVTVTKTIKHSLPVQTRNEKEGGREYVPQGP
ncbi:hypothetical protein J1614_009313 [Plenodomus biglobosus]|nr:hypothetical protein J1614_009313 [Plenodomus biglobosus]